MNDIELKLQKSSNSAIINVYSKTINQFAVFSSCDVDSFVKLKQDVHSLGFEFKEFVGILNNNEIFLLLIQGISNKKANQIAQKYNISLFFFMKAIQLKLMMVLNFLKRYLSIQDLALQKRKYIEEFYERKNFICTIC